MLLHRLRLPVRVLQNLEYGVLLEKGSVFRGSHGFKLQPTGVRFSVAGSVPPQDLTDIAIFSLFNMGALMYFFLCCFCLLRVGGQ